MTRIHLPALLGALLLASFGPSGSAAAQTPEQLQQARESLSHEPTVQETMTRAMNYFRVDPDSYYSLRRRARTRGLLPMFAAGYRYDDDTFSRAEAQTPTPVNTDERSLNRSHAFNVGALWDLRELAFNASEVEVYGVVALQRDILLEVTRTFFLRRQLQLRLMLRPPSDPLARAALELRVQEYTALLDALTDNWFTRQLEARLAASRRAPTADE